MTRSDPPRWFLPFLSAVMLVAAYVQAGRGDLYGCAVAAGVSFALWGMRKGEVGP